jgi:hypothetical protein
MMRVRRLNRQQQAVNATDGGERDSQLAKLHAPAGRTKLISRLIAKSAAGMLVVMLLYAGAYAVTGTADNIGPKASKVYRHKWQSTLFWPAVQIDSAIRRQPIEIWTVSGEGQSDLRPFTPTP